VKYLATQLRQYQDGLVYPFAEVASRLVNTWTHPRVPCCSHKSPRPTGDYFITNLDRYKSAAEVALFIDSIYSALRATRVTPIFHSGSYFGSV